MKLTLGNKAIWESNKIRSRDWLLIVGLCIAPMTGLRIWKIGPAEVLCLIWGIKFLFASTIKKNEFNSFFFFFIIALILGSLVGYYVAPNELRVNNLFTWGYLGIIAISISNGLNNNSLNYNELLLFTIAKVSTVWYFLLFIYSRTVSQSFLGAPLWYSGSRFSGGGTNPHQIAILLCALAFIFLRDASSIDNHLFSSVGLIICLFLILNTDSSTAILSVALSLMVAMYFYISDRFNNNRKKAMFILTILLLIVFVVGFSFFYDTFIAWVARDSNGLGRFSIFSSFPRSFMKSPIFGLGPGVHGRDGLIEFHNTYLEVLAASGILGGVIFFLFSVRIIKKTLLADWKLFIIILSMYSYGLAGFAMRRLVFWGIIAFVVVIASQLIEHKQEVC